MARIRTIKPEFPQSESMGRVSRDARLTFIQLWTLADDEGRLRGASRMLASLLFPYDDDAKKLIEGWLTELEREKCIDRYSVDGTSYIQIRNWLTHQKIDRPTPSKIPPFDESSRALASDREPSSSDLDLEGTRKGSGKDQERAAAPPPAFDPSKISGLNLEAWDLWAEHRKAIRKPIRPHSLPDAAAELAALGDQQLPAVRRARAAGWQGLHAKDIAPNGHGSRPKGKFEQWRERYGEHEDQGFG